MNPACTSGPVREALRLTVAFLVCGSVCGCEPTTSNSLDEWTMAPRTVRAANPPPQVVTEGATEATRHTLVSQGSGLLLGRPASAKDTRSDDQGIIVNLVNTSIGEAAKTVLGDVLKVNYSLGGRVDGKVTIQTARPVSTPDLIKLFQDALHSAGATVIRDGDVYRIEPADTATAGTMRLLTGTTPSSDELGESRRIVQLHYISASEMVHILEPMAPKGAIIRGDDAHNAVIFSGDGSQVNDLLATVAVFDVDTMKGMSVASVPVSAGSPDALAANVRAILGSNKDGAGSLVKLVPNDRLKTILVISSQSAYVARAEAWIRKLDARAQAEGTELFSYAVQNRSAGELVKIINSMLSESESKDTGSSTSPRFEQTKVQTPDQTDEARLTASSSFPASGATAAGMAPVPAAGPTEPASAASAPDLSATNPRSRVVADDENNKLLIVASREESRRILRIAHALDVAPSQVFIEATIAEVSLSDDLHFGLRWYFANKNMSTGITETATSAFGAVYPGFSWARTALNAQVTLNALSAITTVKVISSPSLTVLDNHTATLQVGDQVPIVTQSATSVSVSGAPIVNSVSYRDTGVILSITPRVNESGRVVLTIEQEVSSVSNTTTSSIDSPTISQRRVKTTVSMDDGQALALGGLIQERSSNGAHQVPVLGDIPVVGAMFRDKNDNRDRTELIVLLTPRVIRDRDDAAAVTDEYRRKFDISVPRMKKGRQYLSETVERGLE